MSVGCPFNIARGIPIDGYRRIQVKSTLQLIESPPLGGMRQAIERCEDVIAIVTRIPPALIESCHYLKPPFSVLLNLRVHCVGREVKIARPRHCAVLNPRLRK